MASSAKGVVVSFDADRGFGFIRSRDFEEDVFVHVSAIRNSGARMLRVGQPVRFHAEPDDRGPRAVWVDPAAGSFRGPAWLLAGLTPGQSAGVALGAAVLGAALALRLLFEVPWVGAWLAAINPATLAVYAWDKHRAARGRRRVPEWALLTLALIGGSPGAAVAMSLLRHKTRKSSFRLAFAAIVAVQGLLLVAWFTAR